MRLSIVPAERRFYALFSKQGELVSEALAQFVNRSSAHNIRALKLNASHLLRLAG